jgi:TfoX/Sxy family transcriptional regulator of competence genes
MAYSERLAERVRSALATHKRVTEKKMFGGLAFLVGGRMCCGIVGDTLMVRVGPERYAAALSRPHARPMDFTGRPLTGFVYVAPAGIRSRQALAKWIGWSLEFASTLPAPKRRSKKSL